MRIVRLIGLGALLCVFLFLAKPITAQIPDTSDWPTSTPEAQGMDSAKLTDLLEQVQGLDVDSITVIRHGYMVLDVYIPPSDPTILHGVQCVTKSVTAALVGIALEQGKIASTDQPMLELLPGQLIPNVDPRKKTLTLDHVLTMASGVNCQPMPGIGPSDADAWVADVLGPSLSREPGDRFEYCNANTYLLGAAVELATGTRLQDFAGEYLFDPLGIAEMLWETDDADHALAWSGLHLRPHDMARLGYLFLRGGVWNDERILSADYVDIATTAHITTGDVLDGYGYQWWVEGHRSYYAARGAGGQFIFVAPDLDLVTVFTGGLADGDIPVSLFENYVVNAVANDRELPENPKAVAQLQATVYSLIHPMPEPVPPLPDVAAEVSGYGYTFAEDMGVDFETLMLTFEDGADQAILTYYSGGFPIELMVGLDGLFRTSQPGTGLRGHWEGEQFVIQMRNLGEPLNMVMRLSFSGDTLTMDLDDRIFGIHYSLVGVQQ